MNVLHAAGGDAPPASREVPDFFGIPLFDDDGFVTCAVGNFSDNCVGPVGLVKIDPDLLIDPDTDAPYSDQYGQMYAGMLKRDLEARATGGRRNFTVNNGRGGKFKIRSLAYYFGENGQALLRANADAGLYAAEDPYDCTNLDTTDDSTDPTMSFVTEHGVELQYLPRLLEFLMTGLSTDPDGTTYTTSWMPINPTDPSFFNENSLFQQDYATWDPTGTRTGTRYSASGRPLGRPITRNAT